MIVVLNDGRKTIEIEIMIDIEIGIEIVIVDDHAQENVAGVEVTFSFLY